MNNSTKNQRLDRVETKLTPRQWAIRIADEMRRHPSQVDFLKTLTRGTYRESPLQIATVALAEQAHLRHPNDPHRESDLSNNLRMELHALDALIVSVNREIVEQARAVRRETALLTSRLHTLILQGMFACMDIPSVLLEETPRSGRVRHASLLNEWAEDAAKLLAETLEYRAALRFIEENYFGSHPILFRDFEIAFEDTIQAVIGAISRFKDYRKTMVDWYRLFDVRAHQELEVEDALPTSAINGSSSTIQDSKKCDARSIVEGWVSDAEFSGTSHVLRESGRHQQFIWQHFRKRWHGTREHN